MTPSGCKLVRLWSSLESGQRLPPERSGKISASHSTYKVSPTVSLLADSFVPATIEKALAGPWSLASRAQVTQRFSSSFLSRLALSLGQQDHKLLRNQRTHSTIICRKREQ